MRVLRGLRGAARRLAAAAARSAGKLARRVPAWCSYMITSAVICAVGVWLPVSPFAGALGLTRLPNAYWPILAVMLPSYLGLTHVMKTWFHRRFGLN